MIGVHIFAKKITYLTSFRISIDHVPHSIKHIVMNKMSEAYIKKKK